MQSDRNILTQSNFYPGDTPQQLTGVTKTRVRTNFPQIMQNLMNQTQGSFVKDGPERYIKDFFVDDMISSPRFKQDEAVASRIMQIRADSRGSPVRRTFLGNLDHFIEGQKLKERKNSKESTNTRTKFANSGAGIIQSQALPQLGNNHRSSLSTVKKEKEKSTRNIQGIDFSNEP